jgi:hypothetical protein
VTRYWVIRHDLVDSYMTGFRTKWGRFEDAVQFTSKDGALTYADTMLGGACKILEVSDHVPENLNVPEVLTEWYRQRIHQHIARMNERFVQQLQHHQGQRICG